MCPVSFSRHGRPLKADIRKGIDKQSDKQQLLQAVKGNVIILFVDLALLVFFSYHSNGVVKLYKVV